MQLLFGLYLMATGFMCLRFAYEAMYGELRDARADELVFVLMMCLLWPVTIPLWLLDEWFGWTESEVSDL